MLIPRAGTLLLLFIALLASCNDMRNQEKLETFEPADIFEDGASARVPPEGAIHRDAVFSGSPFMTGRKPGAPPEWELTAPDLTVPIQNGRAVTYRPEYIQRAPIDVTHETLLHGRTLYMIYCTPCHGPTGNGDGKIVQRGFSPPPSLHEPRIRADPDGRIFSVITEGYGNMYPYGSRIAPEDRWAIVVYIRVLQKGRNATIDDLSDAERARLFAEADQ